MSTRVLGELVEERTGNHFKSFFKHEYLIHRDGRYFLSGPEEAYDRFVNIHQRKDGILKEQPKPKARDQLTYIGGDGGLRSTPEDYITFLQMFLHRGMLREDKILSATSIDLMTQN